MRKSTFAEKKKVLDKIRGSLFGGAVGDALGYPVEFLSWSGIQKHFGEQGIAAYELDPQSGTALISDDTQMALFTANGILSAETKGYVRGNAESVSGCVYTAYQDWLGTQTGYHTAYIQGESQASWLLDIPELYNSRAPGNTCMGALQSGACGSTADPINDSKGCGGVMRVAPLGLHCRPDTEEQRRALDEEGAELAAITHGHPLGWLPAALLTHIVNFGVYGKGTLPEAVEDAMKTVFDMYRETVPGGDISKMEYLMNQAIRLAGNEKADEENIRAIGEGWTGDEALAISVYCSLRYPEDFSKAVTAAVNHSGDSDSTGAVTGNIMGAWLGYDAIEAKWKENLELKQVILEMAEDLCSGCRADENNGRIDPIWECKYVDGHYARKLAAGREYESGKSVLFSREELILGDIDPLLYNNQPSRKGILNKFLKIMEAYEPDEMKESDEPQESSKMENMSETGKASGSEDETKAGETSEPENMDSPGFFGMYMTECGQEGVEIFTKWGKRLGDRQWYLNEIDGEMVLQIYPLGMYEINNVFIKEIPEIEEMFLPLPEPALAPFAGRQVQVCGMEQYIEMRNSEWN